MKRMNFLLGLYLALCTGSVLPAFADGEERNHEAGTKWVDPVEFYELQDVERTDFQRDYDQGDIDFNKEIAKKGVKVYGLRLKPFCAADYVEKFAHITEIDDLDPTFKFDYQDLYGVRGVPIHEASFCIYTDEGASRTYNFSYKWTMHHKQNVICEEWNNNSSSSSINISNLRLVPTGKGIGLSYSLNATNATHTDAVWNCHTSDGKTESDSYDNDHKFRKGDGANSKVGHFIYFHGARDLILMVGADAMSLSGFMKESEIPYLQRPWPRVYFIVEEILVEDEGGAFLSEEDRQELVQYLEGLTTWLSGEGDPLGLGEHTDANTSAVIGAISTVASILLGNGLAGMLGGGAGSLVDTLVNSATGGANPLPGSDAPDLTKMEGLKGRKPEEEDDNENENEPPPPPEEKLDFLDRYTRVDSDGDFWVRDPVTGKETLYTNNGDGTYRNFNTDQDWKPEEINEHLRYRDENSGPLKQDAETAARNAAEQHAQWEKESKELSQEGKDYLNWKHEQEAAEKKQAEIERLARKYGVPPTEKAVTNAIKYEQAINQIDADTYNDLANQYDEGIHKLEVIDKTCEIGVNVMATCVPGGEAVKDAYTFAKATLVAASEAVNEGKSLGEGLAHVAVGMGNGALGVIQNQAGNLAGEGKYAWVKELGINVATEDLKEGMNAYYQTGDLAKARDAMLQATGKKTAEFGVSKLISYGTGKLKESATNALAGGESKMSEGMAKKVDYWFNKTHTGYLGHRADVFKVKVDGQNFSVGKGQGFSIFYSGAIDTGKLTEGVINETLNQTGAHDWAGNLVQGANDLGVEAAANVAYGAGVVNDSIVNFAKDVKDFSNLAANFGKK